MPKVTRKELDNLMMVSRAIGLPFVDLAQVLGRTDPVLVGVGDLRAALPHDDKSLMLTWDEDKSVTLIGGSGEVIATVGVVS